MNLNRDDLARKVSITLASELEQNLPELVEQEIELQKHSKPISTDESIEIAMLGLAVAALVLQIAAFAIQIRDSRRQQLKSLPEISEYELEVQQRLGAKVLTAATVEKRQIIKRIIQVTVLEILEDLNDNQ
ncbi:hypothetical protein H6G00_22165 [Leptolyngbya sp. FACHB-541]|uniref:hypothetical protein n=1 Tax=Leptolyngbya sp. FACHB-541 TaxID=2692810 RepID=UPI001683B4A0|nr:hypothetical protein [Leptolyngbya sp. FACHB-541]MBD1999283.1 hypothetical protein [Leptolyngbya sp. FACHB-541]